MRKQNLILSALLFVGMALSVTSLQAQCEDYKALIDKLDRAMVEKNLDLLDEIYHVDAIRHHTQGTTTGLDKIKEDMARFYQEIPDAKGVNEDVICNGSGKIVMRWTGIGTPVGMSEKISVKGITIVEVRDGKIAEEWEEMNVLPMMMQMGYELKPPAGN